MRQTKERESNCRLAVDIEGLAAMLRQKKERATAVWQWTLKVWPLCFPADR